MTATAVVVTVAAQLLLSQADRSSTVVACCRCCRRSRHTTLIRSLDSFFSLTLVPRTQDLPDDAMAAGARTTDDESELFRSATGGRLSQGIELKDFIADSASSASLPLRPFHSSFPSFLS